MNGLFISDQRWIYVNGATLSEALYGLADALANHEKLATKGHQRVLDDECTTPSSIDVLYDPYPAEPIEHYRVGICISWTPVSADDAR